MSSRIKSESELKAYLENASKEAPVPIVLSSKKPGEIAGEAVSSITGNVFKFRQSNSDDTEEVGVSYDPDDGYPSADYNDQGGYAINKPSAPKKTKPKSATKPKSKPKKTAGRRVKRTAKTLRRRA